MTKKGALGFLAVISLLAACANQPPKSKFIHTIDSLQTELAKVQAAYDSLNAAVRFNGDNCCDGRTIQFHQLETLGIKNTIDYIKKSLRSNPQLIPLDPVLGGHMHFTNIEVLTDQWIMASYEDGHIMGRSIFSYKIGPEKKYVSMN